MSIGEGRAKDLLQYLDNLVDKGKVTKGAIAPLKTSFSKVLKTVDGEEWLDVVIKEVDVDDYMRRFANLTMGTYSTRSLSEYKFRIKKAIGWYVNFLDHPGWAPDLSGKKATFAPKKVKKPQAEAPYHSIDDYTIQLPTTAKHSFPGLITYPFPLTNGQMANLSLPAKLPRAEAQKINHVY